ncbi:MAG: glycosyltransferase family 2 protein [Planctomycetota bacterium]
MSSSPAPTLAPTVAIAVVVVNHGSADATRQALAALRRDAPAVRAFVVDNSDDDGEESRLAAALDPAVTLLRMPNRGFGAACNVGIDAALASVEGLTHVLLLNPDTVPEPGAVRHLLATFARHPDAGAVGARLTSLDGRRVLFEHGRIRRYTLTRCHGRAPRGESESRSEFVTGACMLLDAGLLRQGLRFDEGYFLYVEDMDLSRAIAARGRGLWVNRAAVVRHADGGTQKEPPVLGTMRASQLYWATSGKVRFARKWLTPWQRAWFYAIAFGFKPLAGLVMARNLRFLRPYLAGLRDGLRTPVVPASRCTTVGS